MELSSSVLCWGHGGAVGWGYVLGFCGGPGSQSGHFRFAQFVYPILFLFLSFSFLPFSLNSFLSFVHFKYAFLIMNGMRSHILLCYLTMPQYVFVIKC